MPTIKLPAGTTHVLCDDVALKITDALYPDDGIDDEGWSFNHGCCWIKYEQEIEQAAHNGTLPVKDPLTRGPLAFMRGNAWKLGVVAIDDLRAYVADRGITVTVEAAPEPQATTPSPAPVVAGSASGGTVQVWTPERKAEARAMLEKLKGQNVKAYAAMTAAEFHVTPTRLRDVLKDKAKKEPAKKAAKYWPT